MTDCQKYQLNYSESEDLMCEGIPIFANNEKALYGTGTNSHSQAAIELKINEDEWRKYEYHWWEKKLVADEYDDVAEKILQGISKRKALKHARTLVKNEFNTDKKIAEWLKDVKSEWYRLMEGKHNRLVKMVEPKLLIYQDKISQFQKDDTEIYNPYQAEKLPSLAKIKKSIPEKVWAQVGDQVWVQVWDQIWDQVWDQVWAQVRDQVWDQVWDQVRAQVGDQIWDQVGDQVGDQIWDQVGDQVGDQIWNQVGATSYWGIKVALGLPTKHWFFDFLKLGIMIVVVSGKVKVFGKRGRFLGEYDEKDFIN